MSRLMEDDSSWEAHSFERIRVPPFNFQVVSEAINEGNELPFSLYIVVRDDILEKIFTFLPITSMIWSTSVCKRWHGIINSSRFLWTHMLPQRPWYFMFTYNETACGYAYDPILRKCCDMSPPLGSNPEFRQAAATMSSTSHPSTTPICPPAPRHRSRPEFEYDSFNFF